MMKKSIEKTRDAYLPMSLLNDGDLDLINNSALSGHDRDNAVMYFMASRLIELPQITAHINKDDLHRLEPLATFLKENFIYKNIDSLPFYFDYVSYKKGTDIITESQQLRLAKDLLEEGYTVYINDLPVVIDQIRYVLSQYGDRVKFEEPTEEVYRVTL